MAVFDQDFQGAYVSFNEELKAGRSDHIRITY